MSTYYTVATYHYIKTLVQDLSTFFYEFVVYKWSQGTKSK